MARTANATRLLLSLLALATLLLHASRTAAVEATIDVVGACPDADAVRHLLAALLSADEASAAPLSIQDRGARFRIRVRKTEMMIEDPGRDCAARARQAAVVATNELQQRHAVFGPPTWVVEKGFVFDAASTSTGIVWAPGAEIRGIWGSQTLAMYAAAGARGPVTLPLANGWRGATMNVWLTIIAGAVALTLSAARCDKNVTIGVDPSSDAAAAHGDGAADAGS
jgi:hypothetical protein